MVFSSSGGIDESSSLAVTAMESLASMTGGCVLASYEMWGRETDMGAYWLAALLTRVTGKTLPRQTVATCLSYHQTADVQRSADIDLI